jgi:pyruvate/2-oxoglutarate/acetoin dehydrogenase E1 component
VEIEVVDLRSLSPIDMNTVAGSVEKTGRVVIVHEDTTTMGIGAEIAAQLAASSFFSLDAPIMRVAAPDTPVPFAAPLERSFIPQPSDIEEAVRQCLAR